MRSKLVYVTGASWWCKACYAGGVSKYEDLAHYDNCPIKELKLLRELNDQSNADVL